MPFSNLSHVCKLPFHHIPHVCYICSFGMLLCTWRLLTTAEWAGLGPEAAEFGKNSSRLQNWVKQHVNLQNWENLVERMMGSHDIVWTKQKTLVTNSTFLFIIHETYRYLPFPYRFNIAAHFLSIHRYRQYRYQLKAWAINSKAYCVYITPF